MMPGLDGLPVLEGEEDRQPGRSGSYRTSIDKAVKATNSARLHHETIQE
jgi:hypothetical protein